MSKSDLNDLETNLEQSEAEAYEQEKDRAAKIVFDYFASLGTKQITATDVKTHTENKSFFFESQRAAGRLKRANIPEEEHDKTQKALITKFKDNSITTEELNVLKAYALYEGINKLLHGNKVDDGAKCIVTALNLLGEPAINNSLQMSLFLKYQYLLYCCVDKGSLKKRYPHVSLSLGKYITSKTDSHQMKTCWSFFHSGNARLTLDLDLREKKNAKSDQAAWDEIKKNTKERQHLDAASSLFEAALEIAAKENSTYAQMLLNERLAIVERRRGQVAKGRGVLCSFRKISNKCRNSPQP